MAAEGLGRAVGYGLDRYPAIVIDGAAVLYGTTDVAQAITRYQAWRRAGTP